MSYFVIWYHSVSCVCPGCIDKDHMFDLAFGDVRPELRFGRVER